MGSSLMLCFVMVWMQFRDTIRRFCDTELSPQIAERIDRENEWPELRSFWKKLGDLGLLGITAPGKPTNPPIPRDKTASISSLIEGLSSNISPSFLSK